MTSNNCFAEEIPRRRVRTLPPSHPVLSATWISGHMTSNRVTLATEIQTDGSGTAGHPVRC